jgi:hypothetical protein
MRKPKRPLAADDSDFDAVPTFANDDTAESTKPAVSQHDPQPTLKPIYSEQRKPLPESAKHLPAAGPLPDEIPSDPVALRELYTRLDNSRGATRAEELARRAFIAKVAKAFFASQQPPAPPSQDEINLASPAVKRGQLFREESRAARISELS